MEIEQEAGAGRAKLGDIVGQGQAGSPGSDGASPYPSFALPAPEASRVNLVNCHTSYCSWGFNPEALRAWLLSCRPSATKPSARRSASHYRSAYAGPPLAQSLANCRLQSAKRYDGEPAGPVDQTMTGMRPVDVRTEYGMI